MQTPSIVWAKWGICSNLSTSDWRPFNHPSFAIQSLTYNSTFIPILPLTSTFLSLSLSFQTFLSLSLSFYFHSATPLGHSTGVLRSVWSWCITNNQPICHTGRNSDAKKDAKTDAQPTTNLFVTLEEILIKMSHQPSHKERVPKKYMEFLMAFAIKRRMANAIKNFRIL